MKFKIITTLVLLVVLGFLYVLVENNQPQPRQQTNQGPILQ